MVVNYRVSPDTLEKTTTSVAPCDQSRTEKVSLGSLEGFHLGIVEKGSSMTCLSTIGMVWNSKPWDSERVPSCAAPHCLSS